MIIEEICLEQTIIWYLWTSTLYNIDLNDTSCYAYSLVMWNLVHVLILIKMGITEYYHFTDVSIVVIFFQL